VKLKKIKKNYYSKKRGSILAYSLIILFLMVAIILSMTASTTLQKKNAGSTEFSVQALQAADSGVQLAVKKINNILSSNPNTLAAAFPAGVGGCAVVGGVAVSQGNVDAGSNAPYDLAFYSDANASVPITACSELASKVKSIKAAGTFHNTLRTIKVAVKINCTDPCCGAGTFTDTRGSETIVYPLVAIGTGSTGRCWFKENLRATKKPDGSALTSYCYPSGCGSLWGRLYDWDTALNGSPAAASSAAKVQGICPSGWHLSSDSDFAALSAPSGGQDKNLKLDDYVTYWTSSTGYTNSTGFSGVPAGLYQSGLYVNRGSFGCFWTPSSTGSGQGTYHDLSASFPNDIYISRTMSSAYGLSVRCVMD
jgi:uncharacterized protein (TIGR02145 family)